MSKKTLLNETTIRRFMKLASLAPLSETFFPEEEEVTEVYEAEEEEEEEVLGDPDVELGDEDFGDPDELDVEPEPAEDVEGALADFVEDIAVSAEKNFGVEMSVTSGAEELEELPPEEGELEGLPPEEGEEVLEPELGDEEEPAGRDMYEEADGKEAFLEAVLEKVQEKFENLQRTRLAEHLSEKIFKRLAKKQKDSTE